MKLKKVISIILSITALAGAYIPAKAEVSLQLNEENITLKKSPFLKDSILMLPLREVAELAQFIVSWDNETQTAHLLRGTTEIEIPVNAKEVNVYGNTVSMPCTPVLQSGTTYVPINLIKAIVKADNSKWDEESGIVAINSQNLFLGSLIGSASTGAGGSNAIAEYDFSAFISGLDYEKYADGASYTAPWVLYGSSRYDDVNQYLVINHFFNRFTTPVLEPGTYTLSFDLKGGTLGKRPEFFFNPPAASSWWYHRSLQSDLADKAVFSWTDSGSNNRARYYLPKIPSDKWTTYKFAFSVSAEEPVTFYLGAEGDDTYLDNLKLVKGVK